MTARAQRGARAETFARTRVAFEAWFGMLGGPASGFLVVLINYPVVDRACVNNSPVWLHVIQAFFLGLAVLSGFTSWRLHERIGDFSETAPGIMARLHFMTTVGLMTSAMAIVEIVFEWIPIFFLGACHGT